ncbi:MAG: ribosome maturation factor RimP [Frankiaceae bacterium]|nr:ribosome maturation factor RimP [Frankiaceae bacterium]MBV9870596.1 ribosome maturation factor RimP [Frankiaceae bacterium]
MTSLSAPKLREVAEPVVVNAGYDLEELTVSQAGRRSVVRVVVDRDGGIDLDDVADLSRAIGAEFDTADATGEQPYTLEVTSPGVDRPLTEPRHWRRNIGRKVTVDGLTGRIEGVSDDGVTLDLGGERRDLRFADLGPGSIVLEFSR